MRCTRHIWFLSAMNLESHILIAIGDHEKQVMIRTNADQGSACPAGMTGTLMAIAGIPKKEVDPDIVVITVQKENADAGRSFIAASECGWRAVDPGAHNLAQEHDRMQPTCAHKTGLGQTFL